MLVSIVDCTFASLLSVRVVFSLEEDVDALDRPELFTCPIWAEPLRSLWICFTRGSPSGKSSERSSLLRHGIPGRGSGRHPWSSRLTMMRGWLSRSSAREVSHSPQVTVPLPRV